MTDRLSKQRLVLLVALCVSVSPCAAETAKKSKISPTIVPNFNQPDLSAANNAYTMSPAEEAYDCRKLTGHLQLRIRQYRSTRDDKPTSDLARSMQRAATPLLAGTTRGIDQAGDNARDLSMMKAYNARLASKKCETFDLETLLARGNTSDPRPIPKPRANGSTKAAPASAPIPTGLPAKPAS